MRNRKALYKQKCCIINAMDMADGGNQIALAAFAVSLAGIGTFFLNPLLIAAGGFFSRGIKEQYSDTLPMVSIVTVVRNGRALIQAKIENALALDYPHDKLELIIYSDGSTDGIEETVRAFTCEQVRFCSSAGHEGKNAGMNNAVKHCAGEIIVFSDADALFEKDALRFLVRHFGDPDVGGVCGSRVIAEKGHSLSKPQWSYIKFDTLIKSLESKSGSISSNDGKIYAVRKNLYRPIPDKVTDDLFVALSIVSQKRRFVFEPEAVTFVRTPSRNMEHEVERRRRIVGGSLNGIWLMRELLNPFKFGIFAVRLFINKVLRRMLPLFLIMLFFSSLYLSCKILLAALLFLFQAAFYSGAFSYYLIFSRIKEIKIITKTTALAFYFCIGNYGALRGCMDFLMGNQVGKWTPTKGV
ncbi:MAG: glycosyltransferase [Nitrospirae bacterium]|nr:MAG: glycosyltransferase [Nitrospirota bacterium]